MRCKFCKKPLPIVKEAVCPHCFAKWTPEEEEKKEPAHERKTVNGGD